MSCAIFADAANCKSGRRKEFCTTMADAETQELQARLATLRVEHRDLDMAIAALADQSVPDQLQLARLKKRKLRLKDEIAMIEDSLVPDLIA
jgi:hypothetical protein